MDAEFCKENAKVQQFEVDPVSRVFITYNSRCNTRISQFAVRKYPCVLDKVFSGLPTENTVDIQTII
jgi:hypothetical protein